MDLKELVIIIKLHGKKLSKEFLINMKLGGESKMFNWKITQFFWEGLAEMMLIISSIYIATIFASDEFFEKNIQANPSIFLLMAFFGILLSIYLKFLLNKK